MIDFDINIEQKSPYLDLLESLKQQSHALNTIHNPKTWCLSALTYALHLNDCLVLFEDLKNRWQKELPFAEAWDVDFRLWKAEVWSAANNTQSQIQSDWKSLCDTDFARFIDLSNKVADGEITIAPLIEFVEGKETSISKIVVDAGRQLSALFSEIEITIISSDEKCYENFLSNCLNSYKEQNIENIYLLETNSGYLPFDTWAASKTQKKLPSAIESLLNSYDKKLQGHRIIGEGWSDCYDAATKKIDEEGLAREIFSKRKELISAKNDEGGFDDIFRRLLVVYYLIEKLNPNSVNTEESALITRVINRKYIDNVANIKQRIKKNFIPLYKNKYDWIIVFNILCQEGIVRCDASSCEFGKLINQPSWFPGTINSKSFSDYNYALFGNPDKWDVPKSKEKQAKHLKELYVVFSGKEYMV